MLTTTQIIKKYGKPGDIKYLVMLDLPYPMRIAWDLKTTVKRIQCHKMIAPKLKKVFEQLLEHYGLAELQRLGIDIFAGCYNFRKMVGGSDWSRHSWGIAIDLDSTRNALKMTRKTAQFAKPAYIPMIEIFYQNGFVGLGPEKNYDWMHFQIAA